MNNKIINRLNNVVQANQIDNLDIKRQSKQYYINELLYNKDIDTLASKEQFRWKDQLYSFNHQAYSNSTINNRVISKLLTNIFSMHLIHTTYNIFINKPNIHTGIDNVQININYSINNAKRHDNDHKFNNNAINSIHALLNNPINGLSKYLTTYYNKNSVTISTNLYQNVQNNPDLLVKAFVYNTNLVMNKHSSTTLNLNTILHKVPVYNAYTILNALYNNITQISQQYLNNINSTTSLDGINMLTIYNNNDMHKTLESTLLYKYRTGYMLGLTGKDDNSTSIGRTQYNKTLIGKTKSILGNPNVKLIMDKSTVNPINFFLSTVPYNNIIRSLSSKSTQYGLYSYNTSISYI